MIARPKNGLLQNDQQALSPSIQAALMILLGARNYAAHLRVDSWDFAEELSSLRTTGISNGDIRWLLQKGLIAHAEEVPSSGRQRRFRKIGKMLISDRTSLTLTDQGEIIARAISDFSRMGSEGGGESSAEKTILATIVPSWDNQCRELRLGCFLVKQFQVPARSQELILDAFEEERWPSHPDDPLPR